VKNLTFSTSSSTGGISSKTATVGPWRMSGLRLVPSPGIRLQGLLLRFQQMFLNLEIRLLARLEPTFQKEDRMLFCKDKDSEGLFWVDRDTDGKADYFDPCPVCNAALEVQALEGKTWLGFLPCPPCSDRLEIQGSIDEVRGERPYILDRELPRYPPEMNFFNRIDDEDLGK